MLVAFSFQFKFKFYEITKTNYGAMAKANNHQFNATIRLTTNLFIKPNKWWLFLHSQHSNMGYEKVLHAFIYAS